jgi:hypothetical protein
MTDFVVINTNVSHYSQPRTVLTNTDRTNSVAPEPKRSFQLSQEPKTGPYTEASESTPHPRPPANLPK